MKTDLFSSSRMGLTAFFLLLTGHSALAQPAEVMVNVYLWNQSFTDGEGYYITGFGSIYAPTPVILTTNLAFETSDSSAYINGVSAIGQSQLTANASIDRGGVEDSGTTQVFFENQPEEPDVWFMDELNITSATLPFGTPVQLQLAAVYSGFISAPAGDGDFSSASVVLGEVIGNGWNYTNGLVTNTVQTNVVTYNVSTTVGNSVYISSGINALGGTELDSFDAYESSISAGITNVVYVTMLTPGAGYTTASQWVYPALLPTLNFQPAAQGLLLTWPVSGLNFALQQNSDLTTTNWAACNSPVTTVNGTNQVTISSGSGTMFYRLVSQ